jgi:hypothetical protein
VAINHFLIVYDLRSEELLRFESFGTDVQRATDAYQTVEGEYRHRDDHDDFEIVLVGAESPDTLRVTHSRYFEKGEPVPF